MAVLGKEAVEAAEAFLLSLADDELVLGHRDSEWCAFAPMIEEDVAFASIAQDEMGHARLYYQLLEGLGRGGLDALAFGRPPDAYRSAVLLERPNGDWAYTIARHLAYDLYDDVVTSALLESSWEDLRNAATIVRREETYHLEHQRAWLSRLAVPGEPRRRLEEALLRVTAEIGGLLEPCPWHEALVGEGILPDGPDAWGERYLDRLRETFGPHGLSLPEGALSGGAGGRFGRHTEDFLECHSTMTEVIGLDPEASW